MSQNPHRDALSLLPDIDSPEFAEECRRQSLLVAESDLTDVALQEWMQSAWCDLDDW